MAKNITTLEQALGIEVESLYCTEKTLAINLPALTAVVFSKDLRDIMERYAESSGNRQLKMERIFYNICHNLHDSRTMRVTEMLHETRQRIKQEEKTRDILLIICLQRINNYKMCSYKDCLRYAAELGLLSVSELLAVIISREEKFQTELLYLYEKESGNKPLLA